MVNLSFYVAIYNIMGCFWDKLEQKPELTEKANTEV